MPRDQLHVASAQEIQLGCEGAPKGGSEGRRTEKKGSVICAEVSVKYGLEWITSFGILNGCVNTRLLTKPVCNRISCEEMRYLVMLVSSCTGRMTRVENAPMLVV